MTITCLRGKNHQKKRRTLPLESARYRPFISILPKWIGLFLLGLLILYRDTKSITACILINNRQANTTDIQKYLSSVVDSFSSGRSGVFLLRGSFGEEDVVRRTTISSLRESFGENELNRRTAPSQQGEHSIATEGSDHDDHPKNVSAFSSNQGMTYNKSDATAEATQFRNDEHSDPSIEPPIPKKEEKSQSDATFQQILPNRVNIEKMTLSEPDTQSERFNRTGISTYENARVLCLSGESYGRTMNQYIQLAVLLHQLGVNGTSVVAFKNPSFSEFFKEWFDPRDDVLVDYDETGLCDAEYDAATLHYLFFKDKWKQVAYQFKTLIPKAAIRAEAELIMKEYSGPYNIPVTTVHRRDLEGACVLFAEQKNLIACPNKQSSLELDIADYKKSCLIDYPMIANETQGSKVVLFTDNQVPELDKTFPIVSNHSFPMQSWMMAKSAVHYGNPFSTVDVVVYYWRKALSEGNDSFVEMRPTACYRPTPIESE